MSFSFSCLQIFTPRAAVVREFFHSMNERSEINRAVKSSLVVSCELTANSYQLIVVAMTFI